MSTCVLRHSLVMSRSSALSSVSGRTLGGAGILSVRRAKVVFMLLFSSSAAYMELELRIWCDDGDLPQIPARMQALHLPLPGAFILAQPANITACLLDTSLSQKSFSLRPASTCAQASPSPWHLVRQLPVVISACSGGGLLSGYIVMKRLVEVLLPGTFMKIAGRGLLAGLPHEIRRVGGLT